MSLYSFLPALHPSHKRNPSGTPAQCDLPRFVPRASGSPACVCTHVCMSSILVCRHPTRALSSLSWRRLDGEHPPALLRCLALQARAGSSREEPRCFEHFARLGGFCRGWRGAVELLLLGRVPFPRLNASVRVSGRAGFLEEPVPSPVRHGVLF